MIRAQRIQGSLFLICALAVTIASLSLPRMNRSIELIAVAFVVLLLGVPHGALDPLFVRRLPGAHTVGGWLAFGMGYAVLAVAVVGLWVVSPSLFLAGFLVISALHFSGDPGPETGGFARCDLWWRHHCHSGIVAPCRDGELARWLGRQSCGVHGHAGVADNGRPMAGLADPVCSGRSAT
jgi:hypothetical protein